MTKTIWFDMTTSMQWTGGVVGIVRAELEVAKNLHAINDRIKFCMEKDGEIIALKNDELTWLWSANDVTAAYLKNRPNNNDNKNTAVIENIIRQKDVQRFSGVGRALRLKNACFMGISVLPKYLQGIALLISYLPLKAIDVASFIFRRLVLPAPSSVIHVDVPKGMTNNLNMGRDSIIVSMGWMDSSKEAVFEAYKKEYKVKLVYLVYDLILINKKTSHLYNRIGSEKFRGYFEWISQHCDFLLFGGETAKKDAAIYQNENHLRIPPGKSVKFGSDIIKAKPFDSISDSVILNRIGINSDFIITVGSIEARKNHDVLYKAYAILKESNSSNIPKLVVIGRPSYRSDELVDNINRDPRVKDNIILLSPSDEELDCLYRNCLFTLLPSFYEGWSLTLPESLGYGKFCLAADVPPLKEIGEGLVDFINVYDPFLWAEKIEYYSKNQSQLKHKEEIIKNEWQNTTWFDCANQINEIVSKPDFLNLEDEATYETLWFDLTTSYVRWRGGVSGIIRSELILAKEILKAKVNVKFFGYANGKIFVIPYENLKIIFEASTIEEGYRQFQNFWSHYESSGAGSRIPNELLRPSQNPIILPELQQAYNYSNSRRQRLFHTFVLFLSIFPGSFGNKLISYMYKFKTKFFGKSREPLQVLMNEQEINFKNVDVPFQKNDRVLSVGIDWTTELLKFIEEAKKHSNFEFTQLIYDLTPVITPHLHTEENTRRYHDFLHAVSKASDFIIFGGETAKRDATYYFQSNGWVIKKADYVKFGSDITSADAEIDKSKDDEVLKNIGIKESFILTVGTIEIRKNHETLYKTYLNLLDQNITPPLLIIAGKPGWKISSFFESLETDSRIKDYIKFLSPSDTELDVLYRNCLFTVLPSMYEGWSLTLPESLSYGKVCITSDVDPLREVGEGLVPFVHPWDIKEWGDKIMHLSQNHAELASFEKIISERWTPITWQDCAKSLITKIGIHYSE